jgi:hypothetical protein
MDLLQLDMNAAANAGAWIDILHPVTGAPVGIQVQVLGTDSDQFNALMDRFNRERFEAAKRQRAASEVEAERRARDLMTIVACTKNWRHRPADAPEGEEVWVTGILMDGQILLYTAENAHRVYTHPGLRWLRDQVDIAIANRANFLKP